MTKERGVDIVGQVER